MSLQKRRPAWTTLPAELVDLILDECDQKTVLSVYLTCKASLASCRRRLFRTVSTNREVGLFRSIVLPSCTEVLDAKEFHRVLLERPDLADLIVSAHVCRPPLRQRRAEDVEALLTTLTSLESLQRIRLDAWSSAAFRQPLAKVDAVEFRSPRVPAICEPIHAMVCRIDRLLRFPDLTRLKFFRGCEYWNSCLLNHFNFNGQRLQLPFNDGEHDYDYDHDKKDDGKPRPPPHSYVRELLFDARCAPSPQILRHMLRQIKLLTYLYIDFDECPFNTWGVDCVSTLLDHCLLEHLKTLQVLCIRLPHASRVPYEPASLMGLSSLEFLRVDLGVIVSWKHLSDNGHILPRKTCVPSQEDWLSPFLRELVIDVCESFRWTKDRVVVAAASNELVESGNSDERDEAAGRPDSDITGSSSPPLPLPSPSLSPTLSETPAVDLAPEAEALVRYLWRFVHHRDYYQCMTGIVIARRGERWRCCTCDRRNGIGNGDSNNGATSDNGGGNQDQDQDQDQYQDQGQDDDDDVVMAANCWAGLAEVAELRAALRRVGIGLEYRRLP